jgi:hypothetical protein
VLNRYRCFQGTCVHLQDRLSHTIYLMFMAMEIAQYDVCGSFYWMVPWAICEMLSLSFVFVYVYMPKQVKGHNNLKLYLTLKYIHAAVKSSHSISTLRSLGNNVLDIFIVFYSPVSKLMLLVSASSLGTANKWN